MAISCHFLHCKALQETSTCMSRVSGAVGSTSTVYTTFTSDVHMYSFPAHFTIIYKIATLMYSILHRRCPQYLLELITFNGGDSGRRCLRSTTSRAAIVQRTRTQ